MKNSKKITPGITVSNGDKFLSPADHVALLLADHDAALSAQQVEKDAAKLQAFRLHAEMQAQQAELALKEARTKAQAAGESRKRLAAELASRYAIDWQTHVLEPMTGQLVAVPKD